MNARPSDLFLNVIEFFGILVPGALLCFLHKDLLFEKTGISIANLDSTADWIETAIFSYIVGSVIFGISVPLNKLVKLSEETKKYCDEASKYVNLPIEKKPAAVFYNVFSYIRLNSPEATTELERQTAEYKLFRSLIVLFFFDFIITFATLKITLWRFCLQAIMIGFAFYRFDFLVDWTYRLAFGYYLLLIDNKKHKTEKDNDNIERED